MIYTLKKYEDIREIILIAQDENYPTWFIQPKYSGLPLLLEYDNGELTSIFAKHNGSIKSLELHAVAGLPTKLLSPKGKIRGELYISQADYAKHYMADYQNPKEAIYQSFLTGHPEHLKFIAYDLDITASFPEKMRILENYGLTVSEYVLFPTNKITEISGDDLETFFINYVSKAEASGFLVDGLVIISDTPLVVPDSQTINNRIAFQVL